MQPCIALALGLTAAGYQVTLGADQEFEDAIKSRNIQYAPLRLNLRDFFNSADGRAVMNGTDGRPKKERREKSEQMVFPMLDDCWAAAQGADALIYDTMLTPAYHIAEKLRIPAIMTSVMPNMSPTKAFPLIGVPKIGFGRIGNRLSYEIYRLGWINAHGTIARWCRQTLKMEPRSRFMHYGYRVRRPIPVLYSYSPLILSSPPDWNQHTLASGYWFLSSDDKWQPPPELIAFLAEGPPPVYVGFGSMVGMDFLQLTRLVISAIEKTGERAVFASGWGGVVGEHLPDFILHIAEAPHDWLFPKVKVVVHHGGAGTVAASLRFGRPCVICPFVTDQFFWGELIWQRGLGPRPIPQRKLNADRLAAALRSAITDRGMHERAGAISRAIQHEDGIARAVEFIAEHFGPAKGLHRTDRSRGVLLNKSGVADRNDGRREVETKVKVS